MGPLSGWATASGICAADSSDGAGRTLFAFVPANSNEGRLGLGLPLLRRRIRGDCSTSSGPTHDALDASIRDSRAKGAAASTEP
jgi:hypothetical protein